MRERARAVGGTLEVSVREPSGLLVRADMPLLEGDVR
jgi:signal transduction histidine kinase